MTREEFFNKLKTGAKWDVGVAINRTNPVPLDANEIFESIATMETYIKSNALAYPGQIVVVHRNFLLLINNIYLYSVRILFIGYR